MIASPHSLVEALSREPGKAEIINGEIVRFMATGRMPAYAAGEIFVSLRQHIRSRGLSGIAVPDNAGFLVHLPHRQSFSPDAAYYEGPRSGMAFFQGAPLFAVEVRSEGDYGLIAEREMAAKRRDYFAAGTRVVWDVDLQSGDVVRVYRADDSENPTIYRRGDNTEAEPVVPGWTLAVDDLFE